MELLLNQIKDIVWGPTLLVLLVGTGIFLTLKLKLIQLRLLPYALTLVFSKNQDRKSAGDISHFQALMTAMAATIGVGNIVGVATAVILGGPGAVFWMWVAGLFGMATKYGEAVLAVKYRIKDANGEMAGGPMYYLEHGLKKKWLGVLFAIFGALAAFGIGNGTQSKAIADVMANFFSVPHSITGLILVIISGFVILGGIKTIGKVTSFFVPIMALFYILSGATIILMNLDLVPSAFAMIFKLAFTGEAAVGGTVGAVIRFGVARGLFSNEAGLGSAPIAAAAAKTDLPGRQALVSMTQILFDTFMICSITGVIIIMSEQWRNPLLEGGTLTAAAFGSFLGDTGPLVISIGLIFFATSTIFGWAYYGEKCFQYLFPNPIAIGLYRLSFVLFVFVGATASLETIWALADILNGLMAIPNLIGLLGLSSVILIETKRLQKKIKQERKH